MNRWHSPPAELYALVERSPATVLLDCAKPPNQESFPEFATEPRSRFFTLPRRVCQANEAAELPEIFAQIENAVAAGYYAAGFFAYECASCFEPTVAVRPTPPGQPLAWFGIYDRVHLFDHRTGAFLEGDPPGLAHLPAGNQDDESPDEPPLDSSFGLNEPQFVERIAAIHNWIRAGDVYQLNFTVPIQVHAPGSLAALYRRLRSRQPVPYGAFLHWQPNRRILSFSPELFFRLEERGATRRIATQPMKGTAPRGRTTREDRALAEWLSNDPKNRAENVMIVDLLRNDLGRLCAFGSVRAVNLFAVERYPTLWQMTSTVTGELRPEVGFRQIFRALFPCGSITGAPKVRAMQLLAEIEEEPRGIYTGAIGFFSKGQTIFNVAIRTLSLHGDRGTMGVGSGIVIDSSPAEEFRECLLKAEFLTRSPNALPNPSPDRFSLVETLLWRSGYPLLELHLDRLEDSACYFAFPFDRAQAKAALLAHAVAFAQMPGAPCSPLSAAEGAGDRSSLGVPRKVRLLLGSEGALHIADEPLPDSASNPIRVCVASQRTDPRNPMLFHKTTQRPLYAEALQAAIQAGYDEVLFLNLRGQVTEGAMHNIFIEKDGRWLTPPVACGLLAGVYRRHLMETRPNVQERVLCIQDLRQADAVHLCNAVRGLRPAIIDWENEPRSARALERLPES